MWLVLCESTDSSALWAYKGLKTLGLEPLELVSSEQLSYSPLWEHRIGSDGISTNISLSNGRIINTSELKGMLNRLTYVRADHLSYSEDYNYIIQELNAFFLSWINALSCPVLNRPTPYGLCGQWRHKSEWLWLAAKAGLPTPYYKKTSSPDDLEDPARRWPLSSTDINSELTVDVDSDLTEVIVMDGHFIGPDTSNDITKGCQRLAQICKTTLLGIQFDTKSADNWIFRDATPLPDLSIGGKELLELLAVFLKRESREK